MNVYQVNAYVIVFQISMERVKGVSHKTQTNTAILSWLVNLKRTRLNAIVEWKINRESNMFEWKKTFCLKAKTDVKLVQRGIVSFVFDIPDTFIDVRQVDLELLAFNILLLKGLSLQC